MANQLIGAIADILARFPVRDALNPGSELDKLRRLEVAGVILASLFNRGFFMAVGASTSRNTEDDLAGLAEIALGPRRIALRDQIALKIAISAGTKPRAWMDMTAEDCADIALATINEERA